MKYVKIQAVNKSGNVLPAYTTPGAAAMDISSSHDEVVSAAKTRVIKTGLYFAIPEGYEIQVRPRSGLSAKYGITVLNSPGTIDSRQLSYLY